MTSKSNKLTTSNPTELHSSAKVQGKVSYGYPLKEATDAATEATTAAKFLVGLQGKYSDYIDQDKKANDVLYDFLGNVYIVISRLKFASSKFDTTEQDAMLGMFDVMMKNKSIKDKIGFTAATPLETKVLRFVCGNLTKAREKAWTRVLKIALKNSKVNSSEISFASWLTNEGGVYEVSNTTSSGIKPSERDDYAIENALGFAGSWLKTEKHDEIQNIMDLKLKQLPEELSSFSITLNHHSFDGSEQSVLAVRDEKAINRVLVLLGRELGGPVRSRPAVLAKEAAKQVEFERVTGRKPDTSRD
jgi:hypothetical protein